jgi:hypothetical protein
MQVIMVLRADKRLVIRIHEFVMVKGVKYMLLVTSLMTMNLGTVSLNRQTMNDKNQNNCTSVLTQALM